MPLSKVDAYEINEIVVSYEIKLSIVRQTEETNRQLMTSLSHDVRTPLTTLSGYLDAAHKGLVTGKDRDDYIETARRKEMCIRDSDWLNEAIDNIVKNAFDHTDPQFKAVCPPKDRSTPSGRSFSITFSTK